MTKGPFTLEEHIRRGVDTVEPIRFRWLMIHLSAWLIAIVLCGATYAAYSTAPDNPQILWGAAIFSVVTIACFWALSSYTGSSLVEAFEQWRCEGIQLLDATAALDAAGGLEQSLFDESGLNGAYYNLYDSSQLLTVGPMRASSLSVRHEYTETYYETVTEYHGNQTTTRQVEKTRTIVDSIFEGLLVVIPVKLPHAAWIILRPQDAGAPDGLHTMRVASPFLTNHYAVGASDQFAAHRALTPTLMESLWDFGQQFGDLPGYSYRGGVLYITVPNYWMDFGEEPSKWSAVTTARLSAVMESCSAAITFLQETAKVLRPT
ncbi:MAG: DUF3137 domain-containing protein [Planctomycetes bacterium]|nr:DUF3137 domain-containing protein [Planctomycetota bacterium]